MSASEARAAVPRVMIVDDDPRSRRLLEGYVTAEGWQARCLDNGPGALAKARSWLPDVVLLDVMMPGMSGLEACRALKSAPETRLVQVMMVTALRGTPDMVQGLDTGADDYLAKPVRREELLAKLRALLRARRLLGELDEAREQLAVRNRELELKKTLAHTLVHDLKNPLAVVIGNLDLLRLGAEGRTAKLVDRCHQAAQRMRKMVADLVDVEELEGGRCAPEPRSIDLGSLARDALEDARVIAGARGVELLGDLPPSPCRIEADELLLRRAIDNLIGTSLGRCGEHGVIRLRVTVDDRQVTLAVTDDGPPIPDEHREDVFEKYAKLQLREAGISINRGLGLTFARLVVEAHGGRLAVCDSSEGRTAFRLTLPALRQPEPIATAGATG